MGGETLQLRPHLLGEALAVAGVVAERADQPSRQRGVEGVHGQYLVDQETVAGAVGERGSGRDCPR